jgi:glycosyltransferase involved in cell wall biosynthesis
MIEAQNTPSRLVLSIVMPAYNEEHSIAAVVAEHAAVASKLFAPDEWELVCLDDCSADQTLAILEGISRSLPNLRVVRHLTNQGIAASFARVHSEAKGSLVYSTGSDGQWPADNLNQMLTTVRKGADLVVGIRQDRRKIYSTTRRVVSLGFKLLPRIVFGVKVEDAGSIKLGRRDLFLVDLISTSPFAEAERIIKAARAGFRIEFVPVTFLPRGGGKAQGARWKYITGSLRDLIRCARHYGFRGPARPPCEASNARNVA